MVDIQKKNICSLKIKFIKSHLHCKFIETNLKCRKLSWAIPVDSVIAVFINGADRNCMLTRLQMSVKTWWACGTCHPHHLSLLQSINILRGSVDEIILTSDMDVDRIHISFYSGSPNFKSPFLNIIYESDSSLLSGKEDFGMQNKNTRSVK